MLSFFESYQKYAVPNSLAGEIFDESGNKLDVIENFNKINIFTGANNSGKSKILRDLLKNDLALYYSNENWQKIVELTNLFFTAVKSKLKEVYNTDNPILISNNSNGLLFNTDYIDQIKNSIQKYSANYDLNIIIDFLETQFIKLPSQIKREGPFKIKEGASQLFELQYESREKLFLKFDELKEIASDTILELKKLKFSSLSSNKVHKIYIPSIRTLRKFGVTANIKAETINEYNFATEIEVYNGQQLPDQVFQLTNSAYEKRQKLISFQELLSKEFFDSKKVILTYEKDRNVLLIKIGEETERPIHELGDGLQMIICLTFPFFENYSGIVVIEEPETFIHPGLQKTFLKFLISHPITKDFQVFLATHSNHIIDSINESNLVSIFSIKKREKEKESSIEKKPDFIIENLAFGNENLLNLLGITSTSVYLSNSTIWVEGITDKLYIQKYISEYIKNLTEASKYSICRKFKEGTHYSFSLTAGDSITHWDFSEHGEYEENTKKILARKLCSKSLVVIDNDFGKNPERKEKLGDLLNERLVILGCPEIENTLSQDVINKVLLEYPSIAKKNQLVDIPVVDRKVFQSKKIGYIIDKVILKDFDSVKKFSDKTNKNSSLKSSEKLVFCKKAIEHVSYNNLTEDAKTLVEKILDFIISRNQFS